LREFHSCGLGGLAGAVARDEGHEFWAELLGSREAYLGLTEGRAVWPRA
jgi:hypothetical protein